jgi:hypothetical protein
LGVEHREIYETAHPLQRRDLWIGAVTIFCFAIFFLSTPILNIFTRVYVPSDMGSSFPLTAVTQPEPVKNFLLSDEYILFPPWELFNRDQVRHGQLPLWNPYNAAGVPQLANYESAVFSIFTLPFYVLPYRAGVIVSIFLKLFLAGYLTFLFLRGTGIRLIAALVGGITFMFSGYMLVWLSSLLPSAAALIPGTLFFVDQTLLHFDRNRRTVWMLIGLFVCQLFVLFAGHPEGAYFGMILAATYAGYQLLRGARNRGLSQTILCGAALLITELLAVGAASIQTFPFVEYLINGNPAGRGPVGMFTYPMSFIPMLAFPNIIGSPADARTIDLTMHLANYNEINNFYIGIVALFLALLGLFLANHKRLLYRSLFFVGFLLVWIVYAGGLFETRTIFNTILRTQQAAFSRSMPAALVALCALTAFGLDSLLEKSSAVRRAWLVAGAGCIFLIGCAVLPLPVLRQTAATLQLGDLPRFPLHIAAVIEHFNTTLILLGFAVVLLSWICLTNDSQWRNYYSIGILSIVFLQSGGLLKDFYPTVLAQYFYPENDTIVQMRSSLNNAGRVLLVQGALMWADVNLEYRIPTISNYDAIDPIYFFNLRKAFFGSRSPLNDAAHLNETGQKIFGIQVVVTDDVQHADLYLHDPAYSVLAQTQAFLMLRYNNALPMFHVVHHALLSNNDQQTLDMLGQPNFDPATTVILDDTSNPVSGSENASADESTALISDQPTKSIIQLVGHIEPGYLVTARLFYPGWKAKVDGQAVPVYRGNYAFSVIPLPKDARQVEFYYDSDVFNLGALVSLCCLCGFLGSAAFIFFRLR